MMKVPDLKINRLCDQSPKARIVGGKLIVPPTPKEVLLKDFEPRAGDHLVDQTMIDVFDKEGNHVGRAKSKVGDLLTDNFGYLLGGFMCYHTTPTLSFTMKEIGGATKTLFGFSIATAGTFLYIPAGSRGIFLSVGSNAGAPARTDVDVGTILGAKTASTVTTDNYNNATYQIVNSCGISLAAGGTIAESGAYEYLTDNTGSAFYFLIAHDAVSPTVTVPAGGVAAVNWTLQI